MNNTHIYKSSRNVFPDFSIKVTKREINKLKRVIKADQEYAKLHPVGSDKKIHFEKHIIHCKELLAEWESNLQKKETK